MFAFGFTWNLHTLVAPLCSVLFCSDEDLAVNVGIIVLKLISMWLLYIRYKRQPYNVKAMFW